MTPYNKMMAIMSILQNHILAKESELVPEKMFPTRRFDTSALELAERMCAEMLPDLEKLD
jgi:hypothetical protein